SARGPPRDGQLRRGDHRGRRTRRRADQRRARGGRMSEVLRRGDRRRAAVDQLQDRIGALDAEIGRVAGADFPATDVYGRARMAVETFLARHSPAYQLSSLRKPGSPRLLDVDARAEDVLALALYLVGVDRAAELLAEGAMRERF